MQGFTVALSGDGDTALVGGWEDNIGAGALWVFMRNGAVWTQQGDKLVAHNGICGACELGSSLALSGDGDTAISGGQYRQSDLGEAWVFLQPLEVSPYTDIAASGTRGGPFSPSSFSYRLGATSGSMKYAITGVPSWLTASSTSGTVTTAGKTITFTIDASADKLAPGVYPGAIEFDNADNAQKSIPRTATLTVEAK